MRLRSPYRNARPSHMNHCLFVRKVLPIKLCQMLLVRPESLPMVRALFEVPNCFVVLTFVTSRLQYAKTPVGYSARTMRRLSGRTSTSIINLDQSFLYIRCLYYRLISGLLPKLSKILELRLIIV